MSSSGSSSYQSHSKDSSLQSRRKGPIIIPRQILVDLDPHKIEKMTLEPLNLSSASSVFGNSTRNRFDWRGGTVENLHNNNNHPLRGSNLQYQKRPTSSSSTNGSSTSSNGQSEILGPITLFKETMMSCEEGGLLSQTESTRRQPPPPLAGPPFYFMANGNGNGSSSNTDSTNGSKKDGTRNNKNKRSWSRSETSELSGDGCEIGGTDLMRDLPTVDVFKTMLFDQFRNPEERYAELMEQLRIMVAKTRVDVAGPGFPLRTYQVLQGAQVAEIFYWCKLLKVNTETFFRALELFDRFVIMFNEEIRPALKDMKPDEKAECMERIIIQKPLRICSCIMLASKMHSNLKYPVIGLEDARTALEKESHKFSIRAVLESEIRVLRVLSYRTHWITPYDLTEQLISLLDIPLESLPQIFTVSMLYLKYSYMRHNKLYMQIKEISSKKSWTTSETFKRTIEYNSPLRAASVVAAASFHVDEDFQKLVISKLSPLVSEPDQRIETISHLLLGLVREIHTRKNIPHIIVE